MNTPITAGIFFKQKKKGRKKSKARIYQLENWLYKYTV